ncbi:hypothetical protein HDG40_005667 [Paraburkholderia sp. JPY158]|uniref:Helix-turn-helix domain-containing protein n=1 Tax=Paraburkholderia atlantica TaxID=2654982 RepID=A0A7W8QCQ7_PARAM|nr:helix-turn-helix domain-containing protein [Paraburkholderia atlantica]MBB5427488.1 hypothetical protein [Paraburkholderia atlantica]
MTVADVAAMLNVSHGYVRKKLLRKHVLRPIAVRRGRKLVLRARVKRYCRKRQRKARQALRELARVSQGAKTC